MASFTHTDAPYSHVHTWTLTSADATGTAVSIPGAPDRTVQFTGTWGGATAVLEGSLDGTTYFTLTNAQGDGLSFTADGFSFVAENALYIRPRLSTAGSGASVVCKLLSKTVA